MERDKSNDQFGIQDGSIARPGKHGPKLTPEQKAAADARREAFYEELRLREQHHRHGDTSGGTMDGGTTEYDEDDVWVDTLNDDEMEDPDARGSQRRLRRNDA